MLHSTVFEILCLLRIVESAMELIKQFYFSNTEKELLLMSDTEMQNLYTVWF